MNRLQTRIAEARAKYPTPDYMVVALMEEKGELAQALLVYQRDPSEAHRIRAEEELLDVFTVLTRYATEVAADAEGKHMPEDMVAAIITTTWDSAGGYAPKLVDLDLLLANAFNDNGVVVHAIAVLGFAAKFGFADLRFKPSFTLTDLAC